jgi:hypothetical protein
MRTWIGIALAAICLAAAAFASSASATVLCESSTAPCPVQSTVEEGESLQMESVNTVLTSSLVNVTCSKSTAQLEINGAGGEAGEAVTGTITSLTFSGCKTSGGTACTVTTKNLPYDASLEATSGGNGTMNVSDKVGAGAQVQCGFFINCSLSTEEASLAVTGGTPASVTAAAIPLEREGGICPEEAFWDATYSVSAPKTLFVPAAVEKTVLCKKEEAHCAPAEIYNAAQEIEGKAMNAEVEFLPAGGKTIECTGSTITGKTEDKERTPLRTEFSGLSFEGCEEGVVPCNVTVAGLPLAGTKIIAHGNKITGDWKLKKVELTFECPGAIGLAKCEFLSNNPVMELAGGSPATAFVIKGILPFKGGPMGNACPANGVVWSGAYVLSKPKPLFVTVK